MGWTKGVGVEKGKRNGESECGRFAGGLGGVARGDSGRKLWG